MNRTLATPIKVLLLPVAFMLAACGNLRPISEYQHVSHVTQHLGPNSSGYGANIASLGVRWRPANGVTLDLLEGYAFEKMHGSHEVFTGRVTVEF